MRAGVLQLSRWGLLERLISADTPSIASALFHYGDGTTTRVSKRTGGLDERPVGRVRLIQDLVGVAGEDDPGAGDADHGPDDVRVCGVYVVGRAGRALELPAVTTVGADGIRSTVADLVTGTSRPARPFRLRRSLPLRRRAAD